MNPSHTSHPSFAPSSLRQKGLTLLQMLATIGAAGLLGAWLFPLLLEWVRRTA